MEQKIQKISKEKDIALKAKEEDGIKAKREHLMTEVIIEKNREINRLKEGNLKLKVQVDKQEKSIKETQDSIKRRQIQ